MVVSTEKFHRPSADSFRQLGLSDIYRRALLLAGYRRLTPVQETAIPKTRRGMDLIVQTVEGKGETLVLALAALERVNAGAGHPQTIIISPSHQVAQRTAKEIEKIAKNLPQSINCAVLSNGGPNSVHDDRRRLLRPCQVISGTPDRLQWLLQRQLLSLDGIRVLILNQAEQLFNDKDLKSPLESLLAAMPSARQSLSFSSALSPDALDWIESHMDYPSQVTINDSQETPSEDSSSSLSQDKDSESGIWQPEEFVWKSKSSSTLRSWDGGSSRLDHQSSQELTRKSPSELSLRSSGSISRKSNFIRFPSRLSRSTSASSIVYSEEGDCEFEDSVSFEETSTQQIQAPLPPTLNSFSDFKEMAEEFEKWREEYLIWQENYNHWFEQVGPRMKDSGLPLPPCPFLETPLLT